MKMKCKNFLEIFSKYTFFLKFLLLKKKLMVSFISFFQNRKWKLKSLEKKGKQKIWIITCKYKN